MNSPTPWRETTHAFMAKAHAYLSKRYPVAAQHMAEALGMAEEVE